MFGSRSIKQARLLIRHAEKLMRYRCDVLSETILADIRQQIEAVAHRMNGFLGELEEVGCVFKGFEEGLVDFYGQLSGRDVFWCWKQGETKIDHWHELDAGYAGRQPIPDPEGSVA